MTHGVTLLKAAVSICALVVLAFTIYMKRNFKRWKNDNVTFIKPKPIFGNIFDVCRMKITFGELCKNIYDATSGPFVGIFILNKPGLLIRNLDLVKDILIKDFDYFQNRTIITNEEHDVMGSNMLLLMKQPMWNFVRKRMTPIFTTSKIKMMSELIRKCSEQMIDYISRKTVQDNMLEVRNISVKYAANSITSASFGIEASCFEETDSPFSFAAERIYNWNKISTAIEIFCFFFAPSLVKFFGMKFIDTMSSNYLKELFWKAMKKRESNNTTRGDLLDILIDMRKQEENDKIESLDDDVIVAQAVQFFAAGFETNSATMTFALWELAQNSEIQQRLREEVVHYNEKYGSISYDSLRQMEYLEKVLLETLRKYPVLPFLDRRCDRNYNNIKHNLNLRKNDLVYIPVMAIHYDEHYYPNPQIFDPDRFNKENVEKRHHMAYLPFGEGPRGCLGRRFAVLNVKIGLAHLLLNYEIRKCEKTENAIVFNPRGISLQPKSQVFLEFIKIK